MEQNTSIQGFEIQLYGIGEAMFIVTTDKILYEWVTEDGKAPDYVKEVEDWDEQDGWNERAMFVPCVGDIFPDKVKYFYSRKDYQNYLDSNSVEIAKSIEGSIF